MSNVLKSQIGVAEDMTDREKCLAHCQNIIASYELLTFIMKDVPGDLHEKVNFLDHINRVIKKLNQ